MGNIDTLEPLPLADKPNHICDSEDEHISPMSSKPNPKTNYGWICPKCEKVYSPNIKECWRCNKEITITKTEQKYSIYHNMY